MALLQLLQSSVKMLGKFKYKPSIRKELKYFSSKFDRDSNNPCKCPCCPQPCDPCESSDPCDPYKKPRRKDTCKSGRMRRIKFCGRGKPDKPDPIPPPPRHPKPCKPRRDDCDEC
ncbi:late cornified envelope-like proline-rich protein 1 isoform X2 [Coccinella septempunctata]|uniref:late cornified envelope-like proline-rich protein 1 isoform X2 n=1 Tax=Coccinella septempunctata TaxID=41139 RepID=UPI001D0646DC|nr:late cornified envelope-like proline-rich protein 1 isoform X2 [Coccinella septempunctata]